MDPIFSCHLKLYFQAPIPKVFQSCLSSVAPTYFLLFYFLFLLLSPPFLLSLSLSSLSVPPPLGRAASSSHSGRAPPPLRPRVAVATCLCSRTPPPTLTVSRPASFLLLASRTWWGHGSCSWPGWPRWRGPWWPGSGTRRPSSSLHAPVRRRRLPRRLVCLLLSSSRLAGRAASPSSSCSIGLAPSPPPLTSSRGGRRPSGLRGGEAAAWDGWPAPASSRRVANGAGPHVGEHAPNVRVQPTGRAQTAQAGDGGAGAGGRARRAGEADARKVIVFL